MKITRSAIDPILLSAAAIIFPIWTITWLWMNWSWPNFATIVVINWILGANISLFAHRAWCHRSWQPHPVVNMLGLIIFHLTMVGNSIGWAGVHREHHRFCDTDKDPHSPYHKSRVSIQFLSYFNKIKPQYILDLARDKKHQWFYQNYWWLNLVCFVLLLILDPAILQLWIAALGLTIFKLHTINSLCHRTPAILLPIENTDTSSNSVVMVLLNLNNGEAWHKNHHQNASNWSFRQRWYEIDPPAMAIWTLTKLGLAKAPGLD